MALMSPHWREVGGRYSSSYRSTTDDNESSRARASPAARMTVRRSASASRATSVAPTFGRSTSSPARPSSSTYLAPRFGVATTGRAAGQRLGVRDAEALVVGGEAEHPRPAVGVGQRLVVEPAEHAHSRARVGRSVLGHHEQLGVRHRGTHSRDEGVGERGSALAAVPRPDEQHGRTLGQRGADRGGTGAVSTPLGITRRTHGTQRRVAGETTTVVSAARRRQHLGEPESHHAQLLLGALDGQRLLEARAVEGADVHRNPPAPHPVVVTVRVQDVVAREVHPAQRGGEPESAQRPGEPDTVMPVRSRRSPAGTR